MTEEKAFEPGEMIFEEGSDDHNLYVILKGDVEISKKTTEGQPKVIAELEKGEFLGEGVLSGITKKPASAKAISETTLLLLSRDNFEKLMKEEPTTVVDFLLSVLEAANSRLTKTNSKLLALYEINQLMNMYRDDLQKLSQSLISKLITITGSQDGLLLMKNPFTKAYRVIYSTSPDLNEQSFSEDDLNKAQKFSNEKGQFLIVNLRDMGSLVLRRDKKSPPYVDDQLHFLALTAEQIASTIKEASEQASEKARKMLERKQFTF